MSAPVSTARTERTSGVGARATRRGEVLGGTYCLQERIGVGGMGEVYAAEHARLGRRVAVKILRTDEDQAAVDRFRREVRAIARLESEYVVNVLDCGEADDGTPYLVMDLLRGEDLHCLLKRDVRLSIPRAVNLILEACHGVAAVHDAGLVHRDLKPGNLFVARRSTGEDWCKILDFGVAKIDTSTWTAEGAVVGTVAYMAPEQLRDGASAGPSVDIYALGAILYECLSGTSPYSSTGVHELMFKVMNEDPTPLNHLHREIPAALGDAVLRAMAKSPRERFATVQEFARAITPFARIEGRSELAAGSDTVSFEGTKNPVPRARGRTTAFLAGLLLGAGVLALLAASGRDSAAKAPSVDPASLPLALQPVAPPSATQAAAPGPTPAMAPAELGAVSAPAVRPTVAPPAARKKPPDPPHPPLSLANAKFDPDNPYLH